MTSELIDRLARECIAEDWDDHVPGYYRSMNIERFAALVAAECAKACVGLPTPNYLVDMDSWQSAQEDISAAIRAKFPMP